MIYIKNDYFNSKLLVNRVKICKAGTAEEHYAIHVNRIDGKRINCWIAITDKMTLQDAAGQPIDWSEIHHDPADVHYYEIVFSVPKRAKFSDRPKIIATLLGETNE